MNDCKGCGNSAGSVSICNHCLSTLKAKKKIPTVPKQLRVLQSHNTSGYRGVYHKYKGRNKSWVAMVNYKGKRKCVGSFHSAKEAAIARDEYIGKYNLPLIKNF